MRYIERNRDGASYAILKLMNDAHALHAPYEYAQLEQALVIVSQQSYSLVKKNYKQFAQEFETMRDEEIDEEDGKNVPKEQTENRGADCCGNAATCSKGQCSPTNEQQKEVAL